MTDNPFGGEGGFDLQAMLEQAQAMQTQLVAAQEELASTTIDGSSGGVTVTLTGTGDLTGVAFAPGSVDAGDAEALEDLADLVVAAYRDAKDKADALAQRTLGPMAGGLGGDAFGGGPGGPDAGPGASPGGLPGGFGV